MTEKALGLIKHIASDKRCRILATDQNDWDRYKFDEIIRIINLVKHEEIDFKDDDIKTLLKDQIDFEHYDFITPNSIIYEFIKFLDYLEDNLNFSHVENDKDYNLLMDNILIYMKRLRTLCKKEE